MFLFVERTQRIVEFDGTSTSSFRQRTNRPSLSRSSQRSNAKRTFCALKSTTRLKIVSKKNDGGNCSHVRLIAAKRRIYFYK